MIKSQRKSSATLWFNQHMLRLPLRPSLLVILAYLALLYAPVETLARLSAAYAHSAAKGRRAASTGFPEEAARP